MYKAIDGNSARTKFTMALGVALASAAAYFVMPPQIPQFDPPEYASEREEESTQIHDAAIIWDGYTTSALQWNGITYINTDPTPEPEPPPVIGECSVVEDGPNTVFSQNAHQWTVQGTGLTYGSYVLGDCWVQGPVTIIAVAPAPYSESNGSVVNGLGGADVKQGFEGGASTYDASLRITYPYVAAVNSSIISSITNPELGETSTRGGWIEGMSVLTVTQVMPASGDFRPPYSGGDKLSYFNTANMDLSHIPTISPVGSNVPTLTEFKEFQNRVWWDGMFEWVGRASHPIDNMPAYGANLTARVSAACLGTTLDFASEDRIELAQNMIQVGIDNYGLVQAGHYWPANGGHASGRLLPILYAGRAFNRQDMLDVSQINNPIESIFADNCQSFSNTDTGLFDYSIRWCTRDQFDPPPITPDYSYLTVNLPTWVGSSLCARMLDIADDWGHDPYFGVIRQYSNEFFPALPFGSSYDALDRFSYDMWQQYDAAFPYLPQ